MVILTQVEIAERIGQSAAEAFAGFYEQYLPKVYRYISYRVSDTHVAEDITSVVFEKALTKFKSFSPEKASFSTWVFTIARNTLTDYFRTGGKAQIVYDESPIGMTRQEDSPADQSEGKEEIKLLHVYVSKLSKVEQEIISLKFGGEMTNRQIAKELGMTESNVGVIVYRAVRKLRDDFRGGQGE